MPKFTQEQLVAAYRKAPEPIQDAYGGEIVTNVVNDIRSHYRLHVDVAGGLEQEIGNLMLGLTSPAEFFGALMLSGTDEKTARGIMEEVNERIFMPLKRQMSAQSASIPAPIERHGPVPEPVQTPVVPTPTLEYQAPTLPGSPVSAPMPPTPPAVQVPEISISSVPPTPDTVATVTAPRLQAPEPPSQTPVPQTTAPAPRAIPIQKEYGADPYREPI